MSQPDGEASAAATAAISAAVRAEQGYSWARYAVDGLFAAGLLGLFAVYLIPVALEFGLGPLALLGGLGALASLLLVPSRREHPVRFLAVLLASAGYLTLVGGLPALVFLAPAGLFCLEAYGVSGWVRRWLGPAIALVLVVSVAVTSPPTVGVIAGVLLLSIYGWARGVRAQRRYRESLLERVAVAERERELLTQQAVAAERNRIARDIHDLVSHSLAVVAVQAAGAERIAEQDPQRAKEALGVISSSARDALGEMRAMLDVLRSGGTGEAAADPSPGLARVAELAHGMADRGLAVRYEQSGQPYRLAPGAELALYRVVQEALTNAVKHGDVSAGADVQLDFGVDAVTVTVGNRVAAADEEATAVPGGGSGQVGMRERLAIYGGRLEAGQESGEYRVRAVLPRTGPGGGSA